MSTPENKDPALRQKKRSTKVRTGCLTCKIRRIKCDETKPACVRCRSSGRECGGYPLIRTLTFEICSDENEKRSFSYYRDQTLKHLTSFQQYRFWDRLVVQASYSHEAVRCMAVAFGAFNEAVDHQDAEATRQLRTMALEQYSRALEQTVNRIDVIPQEHLLIAALMFSFFESIRGHPLAALRHLYSAISSLLKRWGNERGLSVIEDQLRPILAATHVRASSLYSQILQTHIPPETVLPRRFASMREAHAHFFSIAQSIAAELDMEYRKTPLVAPSADHGPGFLASLNEWRELFVSFINGSRSTCNCRQPEAEVHHRVGVLFLQIQYLSTVIRMRAAMAMSEMAFDSHTEDINRIMGLYEQLLQVYRSPDHHPVETATCLGFSPSLLPTLAMLGLRCRDPALRQRIVSAIRSAGSGGRQLGTVLAAEVLTRVSEMEEALAADRPVQHAADVPTEARIIIGSITLFRYNDVLGEYDILTDYSEPDLIRVRYLRPKSLPSPADTEHPINFESFWIDRRGLSTTINNIPHPEDVQPLFPQLLTTNTNLFSGDGSTEDVLMTYRASYCQIFVPPLAPPPPPPPRAAGPSEEVSPRAFVMNSVALGLVGAGELATRRR